MAVHSDVMPRRPRAPLRPRSRRRWAVAAGVAGVWALFLAATGSLVAGTVLFLMLAAAAVGFWIAARCLGISRSHPWLQQLAARPWRDGRDVLQLGLRHLSEVFIVTPSGSLLAPNAVELRMNPADLATLTEMMDLALIDASATEVYQDQVTAHAVALAGAGPVAVGVRPDPAVAAGRYSIRQGRPLAAAQRPARLAADANAAAGAGDRWAGSYDAGTRADPGGGLTVAAGTMTVAEPVGIPLLRLVTNGCVAQTRSSGARAGRGGAAELVLPEVPTVSRLHASFAFAGGHWRITGLGRNGVLLNGAPLAGEQVIRDGDSIRWGRQQDAPVSRVEIGWSRALPSRPMPARPRS